jgi:predicted TIM-barrel fold metal-dependent hydrolase
MRTITLEEHFLTKEAIKATEHLREQGITHYHHEPGLVDRLLNIGAGRVADMDAFGIDVQVLSLAVCGVEELEAAQAVAIAHDTNEQLAAATRAFPGRLEGFATLGLQDPEKAAAELEYCVKKLGFKGALINGTTKGYFLDHERFTPVLAAAQSLDVPIYIHPAPIPVAIRKAYYSDLPNHMGDVLSIGGWGWHSEVAIESLRLIAGGVFDRFPKLKIVIGHMGENIPFALARINSIIPAFGTKLTFTRTLDDKTAKLGPKLQRSVAEYFHDNFYVTSSGFFTLPPLLLALQTVGSDHLMLSIDYPFVTNAPGRELLNNLSKLLVMNEHDIARFAGLNAAKLLKV